MSDAFCLKPTFIFYYFLFYFFALFFVVFQNELCIKFKYACEYRCVQMKRPADFKILCAKVREMYDKPMSMYFAVGDNEVLYTVLLHNYCVFIVSRSCCYFYIFILHCFLLLPFCFNLQKLLIDYYLYVRRNMWNWNSTNRLNIWRTRNSSSECWNFFRYINTIVRKTVFLGGWICQRELINF